MTQTRRDFLKTASLTTAGGMLLGGQAFGQPMVQVPVAGTVGDPALRDVALRAIDAAKSAGASYADVRVSHRRRFILYNPKYPQDEEHHDVGLRVLVNGTWGFAHVTEFHQDLVAQVAQQAVIQARTNAFRSPVKVEMASAPKVANGEWETKIEKDPFDVSIDEMYNLTLAASDAAKRVKGIVGGGANFVWDRETRVFASTDGSLVSQKIYTGRVDAGVLAESPDMKIRRNWASPLLTPAAGGYELALRADLQNLLPAIAEEAVRTLVPEVPVEPGRYELVVDAIQLSNPVNDTLGIPLELDRVLGYEANNEGTSFMAPPKDKLGTKKPLTSPEITLTCNRRQPGAAACGFDDEGVATRDFTLFDKGQLVDYVTNREMANELKWWYEKNGKPVMSNGCAVAENGGLVPLTSLPNVVLEPSTENVTLEDLVKGVKKGMLVVGPGWGGSDQQGTGGQYSTRHTVQEIRNGKLVGYRKDAAYRFLTTPFWKGLLHLGGKSTVASWGVHTYKGRPYEAFARSVTAPAAHFKEVNIENMGAEL